MNIYVRRPCLKMWNHWENTFGMNAINVYNVRFFPCCLHKTYTYIPEFTWRPMLCYTIFFVCLYSLFNGQSKRMYDMYSQTILSPSLSTIKKLCCVHFNRFESSISCSSTHVNWNFDAHMFCAHITFCHLKWNSIEKWFFCESVNSIFEILLLCQFIWIVINQIVQPVWVCALKSNQFYSLENYCLAFMCLLNNFWLK